MALITRISRLFRADFNAVLDRIEEPDVLLKQSLREMKENIYSDSHQLKLLKNEYSQIEGKIKELDKDVKQINQELDICFESNETDLARSQIKRKIEMQRYEKHLKCKFNVTDKRITDLTTRINENKTRLTVMQQKLELFVNEESQTIGDECFSNSHFNTHSNSIVIINEDEIEIAFLREKQARKIS